MTQDEANKKMLLKVVAELLYDRNNVLNIWFGEYEECDTDSEEYRKMEAAQRWVGRLLKSWIEKNA